MLPQDDLNYAALLLSHATNVCVLTGAGVSKESGVPTFRDAQTGLWAQYDPTELATPEAFRKNPKLVWDWYEHRRQHVLAVQPNEGHRALVLLEAQLGGLPIITQNVDDLHERAGSTDVIHLHGHINRHKCFENCLGDPTPVQLERLTFDAADAPPACPYCGRKSVRVDVVWFGEALPPEAFARAQALALAADVMLVVGTSGMVQPAASLPVMALQAGAKLIEVNPNESELSRFATVHLKGASGMVLPQLLEALA